MLRVTRYDCLHASLDAQHLLPLLAAQGVMDAHGQALMEAPTSAFRSRKLRTDHVIDTARKAGLQAATPHFDGSPLLMGGGNPSLVHDKAKASKSVLRSMSNGSPAGLTTIIQRSGVALDWGNASKWVSEQRGIKPGHVARMSDSVNELVAEDVAGKCLGDGPWNFEAFPDLRQVAMIQPEWWDEGSVCRAPLWTDDAFAYFWRMEARLLALAAGCLSRISSSIGGPVYMRYGVPSPSVGVSSCLAACGYNPDVVPDDLLTAYDHLATVMVTDVDTDLGQIAPMDAVIGRSERARYDKPVIPPKPLFPSVIAMECKASRAEWIVDTWDK